MRIVRLDAQVDVAQSMLVAAGGGDDCAAGAGATDDDMNDDAAIAVSEIMDSMQTLYTGLADHPEYITPTIPVILPVRLLCCVGWRALPLPTLKVEFVLVWK